MSNKIRVLIFPAGEVNSMELHDALSSCVNIEVFGASSDGMERHAKFVFKNFITGLPRADSKEFLIEFGNIINKYRIDVIFATHDTIAEFFAENSNSIPARIVNSDKKTTKICRDKALTYEKFRDKSFSPFVYSNFETLPLYCKPRCGQGSVGGFLVECREDIPKNIDIPKYVFCEYLPGKELSVDCLTDGDGNLACISPRTRERMMAGVSVAGCSVLLEDEVKLIAECINSRMKFRGLWYFQIKQAASGVFKLLEVSTRCAGAMCLTRAIGYNLPLMSVYIAMGLPIDVICNEYSVIMDRSLISRYTISYDYTAVFIDYDDTIVFGKDVNLMAIRFLYQCRNKGVKIVLISRHDGDIFASLKEHAIDKHLFSDIIQLKKDMCKSDYIDEEKVIFIDNAFSDRIEVSRRLKIPVFDVDAIEVLLDWQI